jgi:zinc transport system ATP-binding protein
LRRLRREAGMSLLEATGLDVRAGGHQILSGVDLRIEPGEIVTIVGPNGSGKSTLLRALIGAVKPQAGQIRRQPGRASATCRKSCISTRRCR